MRPRHEVGEALRIALGFGLDGAVRAVPHPAAHADTLRRLAHGEAVAHGLDPPRDQQSNPFHVLMMTRGAADGETPPWSALAERDLPQQFGGAQLRLSARGLVGDDQLVGVGVATMTPHTKIGLTQHNIPGSLLLVAIAMTSAPFPTHPERPMHANEGHDLPRSIRDYRLTNRAQLCRALRTGVELIPSLPIHIHTHI